mgnify:CR=1 FL=1
MTPAGGSPEGRRGPLTGLRAVEMVGIGPGPFAAMWLADMGADVIRVDRPGQRANQTRGDVLNRGRRSLAVDLKKPGASEIVLRLIESTDVLIEGYRPGVMERLGLGPDICLERNPRLIYGRMTGWGQSGPRSSAAGHDINYLAATGVLNAIGPAGGRPTPPLNLLADFGGGGMLLVTGILAALVERGRSGRGQVVDAAMAEGASLLATMIWGYLGKGQWQEPREANIYDGGAPHYGTYRCADGKYVALGANEPAFWSLLLDRLGVDDAELRDHRHDRARWPALRVKLAALFATRPREEWCRRVEGSDACLSPVLGFAEAPADSQAVARQAYISIDGTLQPAPAPRFSRTPGAVTSPPPLVGEHSREILRDAGYTADEVAQLEASAVVTQAAPP